MHQKVQKIIKKIRPYIQMHGGDVELLGIEKRNASTGSGLTHSTGSGLVVKLKVSGACAGCSLSDLTYKQMLGTIIREEIPNIQEIVIEN